MSVWAVLAAAGRGERLEADQPKAFAQLGGRPLLAESLERLEASAWIDSIVVVAPPGWEEPVILLAEELGCGKVVASVAGGESRAASVRIGVAEVTDDAAVILVHDAARPLVTDAVVERLIAALNEGWDGAVPGLAARWTRSNGCARKPSSRRSRVTSSSRFRRRRHSSQRSSVTQSRAGAMRRTARRSSRRRVAA